MTYEDVLNHFGTFYRMKKMTGIGDSNATRWRAVGYIPIAMQLRIEKQTNGALKADSMDPKLMVNK